ncbi:MAG: hypothetical protein H7Y59_17005 [Anaerolineales bacterium]|nr:hypothetical protein [Anaerolineales bacterium]
MNSKQNFKTDLIALSHPLTLVSILVLLINDHVLKVYAPSILTGKISDFAGLFFFPILLSAILNLIFKSLNLQARQVSIASFGFTAIWFILIKTIPFFNNFTESVLSVQIIRDPTDLMALVMFLPAWKLRASIEDQKEVKVQKLSYVMLCFASLAALATSPAYTPTIYNLIVHKNIIYAEFDEGYFFYSTDGGKNWEEVDFELPSQVTEQAGKYPELPFTLCLPEKPDICYQTGEETILESQDGGKIWVTSWGFPLGRMQFFNRISQYNDIGPYDLAYIELSGEYTISAAMGTGGILLKTKNNAWESIEVNYAGPIYFNAKSFTEAKNSVDREFQIFCFTLFVFLYINILANTKKRNTLGRKLLIALPLLSVAASILGLAFANILYPIMGLLLFVFVLMIVLLIFLELFTNTNKRAKANLIPLAIITLASYSLFILWAYGIIPVYEIAQWITIGLHVFLLLWIIYPPIKEVIQTKRTLPE